MQRDDTSPNIRASLELATINASQGLILREGGKPIVVLTFETDDHQITVVRAIANPDKLKHIDR